MYRIKLKIIPVLIILFLSNNQCFHPAFDKDVNCTAIYTVYIVNKSQDTLGVQFIDYHPKDDDRKITIYKDTCVIMPFSFDVDTIKYNWPSTNLCVFSLKKFYNIFALVYNVNLPEHPMRKELAPWDTTKSINPSFCGDCTYTYTDTLIIP
jgi:hypothetical protein